MGRYRFSRPHRDNSPGSLQNSQKTISRDLGERDCVVTGIQTTRRADGWSDRESIALSPTQKEASELESRCWREGALGATRSSTHVLQLLACYTWRHQQTGAAIWSR